MLSVFQDQSPNRSFDGCSGLSGLNHSHAEFNGRWTFIGQYKYHCWKLYFMVSFWILHWTRGRERSASNNIQDESCFLSSECCLSRRSDRSDVDQKQTWQRRIKLKKPYKFLSFQVKMKKKTMCPLNVNHAAVHSHHQEITFISTSCFLMFFYWEK